MTWTISTNKQLALVFLWVSAPVYGYNLLGHPPTQTTFGYWTSEARSGARPATTGPPRVCGTLQPSPILAKWRFMEEFRTICWTTQDQRYICLCLFRGKGMFICVFWDQRHVILVLINEAMWVRMPWGIYGEIQNSALDVTRPKVCLFVCL